MPISYSAIPAGWKLPGSYIEVDPSKAGTFTVRQAALLVGQKLAAGIAPADVPIAIGNQAQADTLAGIGSMLSRMAAKFFASNVAQELWLLPVAEPAGGTAAVWSITVTAAPTAAGQLPLYVAGQRVLVPITAGMTTAQVATATAAAINAVTTLPATATANASVVTVTCRWKGQTGNDVVIGDSYFGLNGGEARPAGLGLTYAVVTAGAGAPDFTAAIANLGDEPYEYVAMPFLDSTSAGVWATEYGFSDSGRWGWLRQTYGLVFSAKRDTYANFMTYGPTENFGTISVMPIETTTPSPVWEIAAGYTAKASRALANDPARPLQFLELEGILVAPKSDRFSALELNALAGVGLATQSVSANGKMMILRETTRYQKNVQSQPDNAYELITTLATLAALFRRQRQLISNKFPRHKLANDGTRFGPGQAIVTPNVIKAELVAQYSQDEYNGLVENLGAFKANLVVERDADNPNRVNILYPPDIINQARMFAILAQFRLQYDTTNTLAA
ncbi:MAG: phage tail sheath subtilisin-like domain-containing protein [Pseudolabrys sp.]